MLLLQEIKKIVKSIPYMIFVAAVVIGLFSQGVFRFQDDLLEEPQPGGSYGYKHEEIAEQIMPSALRDLLTEFSNNNYTTYPIGFIKHVKLSEGKPGLHPVVPTITPSRSVGMECSRTGTVALPSERMRNSRAARKK